MLSSDENITSKLNQIYENLNENYKFSCLSINVSEKCNFECVYCFGEGGSYGRIERFIDWNTAKKVIDYWIKNLNKNSTKYYVNFFGGEPFLNIDLLEKSISYMNTFEILRDKVEYIVTTNGSVFNSKIEKLVSENPFEISISIDGMEFIHNKNRPYKNKTESFETVIENYLNFAKCTDKISSQMTVNKNDIKYMQDSVEFLWSRGIKKVYSNLVFDKDILYEITDFIDYNNQIKKLTSRTFENLKKTVDRTYGNVIDLSKNIFNKKYSVNCFARRRHGLIISANGERYSCYRGVGKKEFFLKPFSELENNDFNVIKSNISKCSKCFIQLYCGNGCPYENKLYNDNFYEPSRNFCIKSILDFEQSIILISKLVKSGLTSYMEN